MRVLLTGCTAQQANPASHQRVANFTGLLRTALRREGHEVFWQDPQVTWTRSELERDFDLVVAGIAPITSLGANRAYGALSVIEQLWDSPRLRLLLEQPEPYKVASSLRAIFEHPTNLTKEFFSYRKGYGVAVDQRERLQDAVTRLYTEEWPKVVAPGLPWTLASLIERQLPVGAAYKVSLLNLDQYLLAELPSPPEGEARKPQWAMELGSDGAWLRRQNVRMEQVPLPRSSRKAADPGALDLLRESTGCLIGPDRDGTWWNTRYAMAISQRTPVCGYWQETQIIGRSWTKLAHVLEHESPADQRALAEAQAWEYETAIGSVRKQADDLHDVLGIRKVTTR